MAASTTPPISTTTPPAQSRPTLRRSRTASITQSILAANPHYGVCAATGDALASAPSLKELRRNSAGNIVSRTRSTVGRRGSSVSSPVDTAKRTEGFLIREEAEAVVVGQPAAVEGLVVAAGKVDLEGRRTLGEHEDGEEYQTSGWWGVTVQGLLAFWNFFKTPTGFFVTIYLLNIVAWGGMLFLLLCNAAPAMCKPTCNSIDSPRHIWIEIDSQILNALFCVTGFGFIPWRFRDLYFLLRWRVGGSRAAIQRLAKIHEGWFRVPREESEVEAQAGEEAPEPGETKTGRMAPPTKSWKMDFVVWLYVWNTFLQTVLSGLMWGMNRFNRPSWSTGLFVALACIVAGMAGGMVWFEGRKVKRVEGVADKDAKEAGKEGKEGCGKVVGGV